MSTNKHWVPEIMYEGDSEEALTSNIPFIPVPEGEEMPKVLFIFESRSTGEFEPGPEGEPLEVTELDLHQYANMAILKKHLNWVEYDNVRHVLGLEGIATARKKGSEISDKILGNINKSDEDPNT